MSIVRVLVRLPFAPQVLGSERLPTVGAVFLIANHRSLSDGLFQAAASPRPLRWTALQVTPQEPGDTLRNATKSAGSGH